MAEKKKKSIAINLTAFEILQAITGELPCHASPNGKESDKQKVQPEKTLLRLPKSGRV
jgi:hypothetical protein